MGFAYPSGRVNNQPTIIGDGCTLAARPDWSTINAKGCVL
jgi:hypothetical protein